MRKHRFYFFQSETKFLALQYHLDANAVLIAVECAMTGSYGRQKADALIKQDIVHGEPMERSQIVNCHDVIQAESLCSALQYLRPQSSETCNLLIPNVQLYHLK